MTIISPTPAIPDVLIEDADLREILLALKTIAEIREGRHIDKNLRFITYYELVSYLSGNDQLVVEASTSGHNHDTIYSALSHNHSGLYAEIVDVEGVYALIVHDHAGLYAALEHQHNELYSSLNHDHLQFEEIEARAYWQSII